MKIRVLSSIAAVFLLSACTDMPPLNFSVPNVGVSETKIPAEVKAINVSVARPDEKAGELETGVETIAPYWQTALQDALGRMAIFKDDAPTKINISVKILKLDMPSFGAAMDTDTIARYEIIDRSTGSIVYTQDISSNGHVPGDYAFVGAVRARESVNRSVQNNILQFLQALETVDIKKPMFPVKDTGKSSATPTS
ncbi:hypothetical protein [Oleisolibacter albus]|uniref:hypothetical protein n=1 Tax=Oleisolibacter albus TaxID=2171757 RepID=UPI001960C991|nr:hypothetical protein [Oleisolibacter albus]